MSLLVGLVATAAALSLGTLIGAVAGYRGGWVDNALMRLTEFFQTISSFIFAVVLVAIFQPSLRSIVAAIAMVSWPAVARLVRGEFIALRHREFVMIGSSRSVLRQAWWMSAVPGVAIFLTVLALNLVGEGLNDALNPRLRRR